MCPPCYKELLGINGEAISFEWYIFFAGFSSLQILQGSQNDLRCPKLHPRRIPKQCMVVLWNLSNPHGNEDRIAGKGFISMVHDNLVHEFIPLFQAMKTLDAKAAVDKEWKKLETIPSCELERSHEQEGGCSRSTKKQKESPRCYTDGPMSLQECGVITQITKIQKTESCSVVTL